MAGLDRLTVASSVSRQVGLASGQRFRYALDFLSTGEMVVR